MSDNFKILPWMEEHFSEREIREISFCRVYSHKFAHGTDGHNIKLIVSTLTGLLNQIHFAIGGPFPDIDKAKETMGQKEAKNE